MDNKIKKQADDFWGDLLSDEEMKEILADTEGEDKPTGEWDNGEKYIVYFKGDKPDCVWQHFSNPEDGLDVLDDHGNPTGEKQPYGRLYGFWDQTKGGNREFKEHKSKNLKLMDFDRFMEIVVPNKDCTKIFDSEEDFLLELI